MPSILFGTPLSLVTGTTSIQQVLALSSTTAIAVYAESGDWKAVHLTVNASTLAVTKGTAVTLDAAQTATTMGTMELAKWSSTEVLAVYQFDDGTKDYRGQILSISGTTITAETAVDFETGVTYVYPSVANLAEDKWIAFRSESGGASPTWQNASVITQSGVGLTLETALNTAGSLSSFLTEIEALSATAAVCLYTNGSALTAKLLAISGTTVTLDDSVNLTVGDFYQATGRNQLVKLSATKLVSSHKYTAGGDTSRLTVLDIDGATITAGSDFVMPETQPHYICNGSNANEIMVASSGTAQLGTYSVSGTTITQDGNEANIPNTATAAMIDYLGSDVWVGVSVVGSDLETFGAELGTDYTYTHNTGGLPGSII